MRFKGWQKTSFVDYPGKIVSIAFTGGCNFRCPYCHNRLLVENGKGLEDISAETVLDHLDRRAAMLDGICVSGGEPTLMEGLEAFAGKVRERGKRFKLDTNGSRPAVVSRLLKAGLVDYIAMDIKCVPARYRDLTGCRSEDLMNVKASVRLILESGVPHEFRSTLTREYNPVEEAAALGEWTHGAERYALQKFRMPENPFDRNLTPVSRDDARAMADLIRPHAGEVVLRGYGG